MILFYFFFFFRPGTFASYVWTRLFTPGRLGNKRMIFASGASTLSSTTCLSSTTSTSISTGRLIVRKRRTRPLSVSYRYRLHALISRSTSSTKRKTHTLFTYPLPISSSFRYRHDSRQHHHVSIPYREMVPRRGWKELVQRSAITAHQMQIPNGRHPPAWSLRGFPRGNLHFIDSAVVLHHCKRVE